MSAVLAALRAALGSRVSTDADVLDAHRHDYWALAKLHDLEGRGRPAPLCVVSAASVEDVSTTLRLCREFATAVVPFGAGSGVCGGVETSPDQVVLSMREYAGLVALDEKSLTATFRAGTMGNAAEDRVQEAGLTIGHWPQSIAVSTVGGWVATRAAGQFSTAYGNIEDLVLDLEVVLPDGRVMRTHRTPRAAAGPDLRHLFLGSEGTMGVVTEVTFSLRPLPEASRGAAFHFPDFDAGLDTIRRFMRVGWRPPVVRLYDAHESARQFSEWCPEDRHLLVLLHEGPASLVEAEIEAVASLCRASGGIDSPVAAVDHWLAQRNHVPTFEELLRRGLVVDTIEVAATWDRIGEVYTRTCASLREVPDLLIASAHSSHSYRSGANLYFTFVARPADRAAMADTYRECWRRTMDSTVACGGGIAHHHGIGRVRRDWLAAEIGDVGVDVLRSVKAALDPAGLLNPGSLLPDAES